MKDKLDYFHNGAWTTTPMEGLISWEDENEHDADDMLEANGYVCSEEFGDPMGWSCTLYEHAERNPDWMILFVTANRWNLVHLDHWPDLIELLSKVSPSMTLAGMYSQAAQEVANGLAAEALVCASCEACSTDDPVKN